MDSTFVLLHCKDCWTIEHLSVDKLENHWPACCNPTCRSQQLPLDVLEPIVVDEDLVERNVYEIIEQAGVAGLDRLIEMASAARSALSDP